MHGDGANDDGLQLIRTAHIGRPGFRGQAVGEYAANRGDIFAARWLKTLPRRWARNGAVFGTIFAYAQVGGNWEVVLNNGYELRRFAFVLAVISLGSALLSFLAGLWARKALSPVPNGKWASTARSIPRKWVLGANLLGLLMILADVVFDWRDPAFQSGGSAEAIANNLGGLVGFLLGFSVTGSITGLISRRGLRRAISDDELCASDWRLAGEVPNLLAPAPILNARDPGDLSVAPQVIAGRDEIAPTDVESGTGRLLVIAGVMTVVLVASASLMIYLSWKPKDAISPEVVARLDPKSQLDARRLRDEPCNRTLAAELVTSLLAHAEYGAIVGFSERTAAKCGPNEELLAAVFTAQLRSSDFAAAERTADQLVVKYPADPNVFGWRAEARGKRSNFAGAYADMRTALSFFLDPSDVDLSVYYDLARLAAKAGHPCEAVVTLRDYIAFDPEKRRTQQLTTLMRGWQSEGSCAPLTGTGSALLRFNPNATAIIVSAKINGVPARMIVDTGATRTTLSKQFASRAGIEPSGPQGAIVATALGKTWLPGGRADYLSLGGASLSDVPVFIENSGDRSFGDDIDGLLGLSFLGNFHVRIGGGVLELRPAQ